jgi:glucoamylase
LFFGKASGSACPLVWAHSEYIKLVRSLRDGKIFDQSPQTVKRYRVEKRRAAHWEWRFNNKCRIVPKEKVLRIALQARAVIHWSKDGWQTAQDLPTQDTGLGIHFADLPTDRMDPGHTVQFTFFWPDVQRWENVDFAVNIQD